MALLDEPTPALQREFEEWLRADPAHFEAYQAVETTWHETEKPGQRLAEKEADELAIYLKEMDKAKSDKKTFRRLSILSVVLALLLGGGVWLERPGFFQNLTADFTTERGERRTVMLSDGSSVLLDADSALADEYTSAERRVRLIRGGAFFDVRPSSTPFIVEAANGEVRVLGTGFDVRLLDDGGLVTLEHGSVSVSIDHESRTTVLEPGQQVRFGAGGIDAVQNVELQDALAWRGGRFIFYRARLADVVQVIQRYRRGRVVIATSKLSEERVTGSFSLSDTDAALSSLQASVGFRMNTVAGRLTVVGP